MFFKSTRFLVYGVQRIFFAGALVGVSPVFAAEGSQSPRIRINEIRCEGAKKTSCGDLTQILGISPRKDYSEDELNALNLKMRELGYYSSSETRLEPLSEEGVANLVLSVVEQATGRLGVQGVVGFSTAHPRASAVGSFSDHNFLGKGHYLNVTFGADAFDLTQTTEAYGFPNLLQNYNLEYAAPLGAGYIGSLRALSLGDDAEKDLLAAGLGYQLDERSFVMAYVGNAIGINYTYASEDNGFIPTSGALVSGGLFRVRKLTRSNQGDSAAGNLLALDARKNWQVGRISDRQGVLTLSMQFNNHLNPTFKSFDRPAANGSRPENGIIYSLVATDGEGRRSSWFLGTNGIGFSPSSDSVPQKFYYRAVAGYKAALPDIDVGFSLLFAPEQQL